MVDCGLVWSGNNQGIYSHVKNSIILATDPNDKFSIFAKFTLISRLLLYSHAMVWEAIFDIR